MGSKKIPLAMNLRLVIDDFKRLAYECEIVFDDGSVICKRLSANSPVLIHFEDWAKELKPSIPPPS